MNTFAATDTAVQQIAGMFKVSGWKWAVRDGKKVRPYIPNAEDIARNLNHLYESTQWSVRSHECEVCDGGDREACAERPHWGAARSGRLFVEWNDGDGYGQEITYGIDWTLPPAGFAGMVSE